MSDLQPIYLVDVIGDVVTSVQKEVLSQIQDNENAATGSSNIQTINYQYGHKAELIETLFQMDKINETANLKYPCIYLVQDFRESISGGPGIYGTAYLNIIIMHQSLLDYKTADRYVNVFKPVLYPLYASFMKQVTKHKLIHAYDYPKHDKFDRPLTVIKNPDQQMVNDYVDAIEISNLSLLIDLKTCIN